MAQKCVNGCNVTRRWDACLAFAALPLAATWDTFIWVFSAISTSTKGLLMNDWMKELKENYTVPIMTTFKQEVMPLSSFSFVCFTQGSETGLGLWSKRIILSVSSFLNSPLFSVRHMKHKLQDFRTHCWQQVHGRSVTIQRWVLERICGALRHMPLSCVCWTPSFTWWRSWRSGWVSGQRVSGTFLYSCTAWLPWWRSWSGLSTVPAWTTSVSSTRSDLTQYNVQCVTCVCL